MPKPVLALKKEQEKTEEVQEKNVLVLPMSEASAPAPAKPTMPPQPQLRVAQPMEAQAKFEVLLEWISSLSEDQIRTFLTPEGVKDILDYFAKKGDLIARLAKAHCYK